MGDKGQVEIALYSTIWCMLVTAGGIVDVERHMKIALYTSSWYILVGTGGIVGVETHVKKYI